jgi:hypothetical protein
MSENETTPPATGGAVKGLVEEHPVAMLAGGILLGALIAGALSRRPAQKPDSPSAPKPRSSFGKRARQLAALGAELAAAYVAGAEGARADEANATQPLPPAATATEELRQRRLASTASTVLRTLIPVLGPMLGRSLGAKGPRKPN